MAGIAPVQLLGIMQEVGRDGRSPKRARTASPRSRRQPATRTNDERGVQPLLPPLSARMWRQSASVTGALELGFADVLQWWEARFERIALEDRNLPEIAPRRVLRPRSEAARQQIDRAYAYADTEKVRREVFETLLTPRADSAMFRKVYPFSPALVETLVAVSSLLQRKRTALKVMLQILVDRRETLDLGEIVPVGDLFDAIAEGDEAFTESTRHHFENARNLYRRKLLPLIESLHGIAKAEAETRPKNDKAARALRAEDRLAKTLLLSALAPEVDVLKNLTATSCIPSFCRASDHAEDISIHPLFHQHAPERLHQRTNPILGPIGKMVVQHQPLPKQRMRPPFHRVRLQPTVIPDPLARGTQQRQHGNRQRAEQQQAVPPVRARHMH